MNLHVRTCLAGFFALTLPEAALAKSQPPPQAYFAMSPRDLASRLSGMCMDAGLSITAADESQVSCGKEVSGFKGALTQMLIGNSYSTTPTDNVRFQLIPWNGGTRVQVSEWVETQMAFGQVRRMPINNSKATNGWLTTLYNLGGTEVPRLQIGPAPALAVPPPQQPAPPQVAAPATVSTVQIAPPAAKPKKAKSVGVICVTCE
jgi:hypothetical protein